MHTIFGFSNKSQSIGNKRHVFSSFFFKSWTGYTVLASTECTCWVIQSGSISIQIGNLQIIGTCSQISNSPGILRSSRFTVNKQSLSVKLLILRCTKMKTNKIFIEIWFIQTNEQQNSCGLAANWTPTKVNATNTTQTHRTNYSTRFHEHRRTSVWVWVWEWESHQFNQRASMSEKEQKLNNGTLKRIK